MEPLYDAIVTKTEMSFMLFERRNRGLSEDETVGAVYI